MYIVEKNLIICENANVMHCPNCKHSLKPEKIGSTVYWKCKQCNILWFDNKENDFLTLEEAEQLTQGKSQLELVDKTYLCPRCHKKLNEDTYYYRCYQCGGVLTDSQGLIEEKQNKITQVGQSVKPKPLRLSQFKSVVVVAGILVFFGLNLVIFSHFNNRSSYQSQASSITKEIRFQPINDQQLAIFFTTEQPYLSEAEFSASGRVWNKNISTQSSLTHFLIIESPLSETNLIIKLKTPDNNQEFKTESITVPLD